MAQVDTGGPSVTITFSGSVQPVGIPDAEELLLTVNSTGFQSFGEAWQADAPDQLTLPLEETSQEEPEGTMAYANSPVTLQSDPGGVPLAGWSGFPVTEI